LFTVWILVNSRVVALKDSKADLEGHQAWTDKIYKGEEGRLETPVYNERIDEMATKNQLNHKADALIS
jgi:hypothetical protein